MARRDSTLFASGHKKKEDIFRRLAVRQCGDLSQCGHTDGGVREDVSGEGQTFGANYYVRSQTR